MPNNPNQELEALKKELIEIHKTLDEATLANKRSFIDSLISKLSHPLAKDSKPSLLDELEQQAATVTSEHPRLSGVLREIADVLGKLGI